MGGDRRIALFGLHSFRFNPRPRMGGDLDDDCGAPVKQQFQSTPPHGGRPYRYNMIVVKAFNQCFCELYSKEANILLW